MTSNSSEEQLMVAGLETHKNENRPAFDFEEIYGDLFSATDSLAHCVSEDLAMGKGIAIFFKEKFGSVDELQAQHKQVGEVAYLKRDDRYIFYIITKKKFFHKPSLEDFEKALKDLKSRCEELHVKSLSLPRIGTGLDNLNLTHVKETILKVFEGCELKMKMYYL